MGTLLIGEDQKFLHPDELDHFNCLSILRSRLTGEILLSGSDGRNGEKQNYVYSNRTIIKNIIDKNLVRHSDSVRSNSTGLMCNSNNQPTEYAGQCG